MEYIGIATIDYGDDGMVNAARFEPDIKFKKIDLKQLRTIPDGKEEDIKHNAEMVLASWFNNVNMIELADRDKFKIESVVDHVHRVNGRIIQVVISFYFKEI